MMMNTKLLCLNECVDITATEFIVYYIAFLNIVVIVCVNLLMIHFSRSDRVPDISTIYWWSRENGGRRSTSVSWKTSTRP